MAAVVAVAVATTVVVAVIFVFVASQSQSHCCHFVMIVAIVSVMVLTGKRATNVSAL